LRLRLQFVLGSIALLIGAQAAPIESADRQPSQMLEIRLAKPLAWQNGCLPVSFDLLNRSGKTVFLPAAGIDVDFSAKLLSSVPEKNGTEEWLNLNASDFIPPFRVMPFSPGAMLHRDYCARPSVWVVDAFNQSWREIAVRGKLKVNVQYYMYDPTLDAPRKKSLVPQTNPPPQWATLVTSIPCPGGACAPGCEGPPFIVEGETRVLPDIPPHESPNNPEAMERGNERNAQLRNLLSCSE
jgi:hypothetical protein